jgi:hypothetical protein
MEVDLRLRTPNMSLDAPHTTHTAAVEQRTDTHHTRLLPPLSGATWREAWTQY